MEFYAKNLGEIDEIVIEWTWAKVQRTIVGKGNCVRTPDDLRKICSELCVDRECWDSVSTLFGIKDQDTITEGKGTAGSLKEKEIQLCSKFIKSLFQTLASQAQSPPLVSLAEQSSSGVITYHREVALFRVDSTMLPAHLSVQSHAFLCCRCQQPVTYFGPPEKVAYGKLFSCGHCICVECRNLFIESRRVAGQRKRAPPNCASASEFEVVEARTCTNIVKKQALACALCKSLIEGHIASQLRCFHPVCAACQDRRSRQSVATRSHNETCLCCRSFYDRLASVLAASNSKLSRFPEEDSGQEEGDEEQEDREERLVFAHEDQPGEAEEHNTLLECLSSAQKAPSYEKLPYQVRAASKLIKGIPASHKMAT